MAKSSEIAKQQGDDVAVWDTKALLEAAGIKVAGVVDASQEIGDGWEVIDQADLVGVPFLVVDYRFRESDKFKRDGKGLGFVIVKALTDEFLTSGGMTGKYIFTDGSTGVFKQLGEWVTDKNIDLDAEQVLALACRKGLVASNYRKTLDDGTEVDATTYYIA